MSCPFHDCLLQVLPSLCFSTHAQLYLAESCHQQAGLLVRVTEGHLQNLPMKENTLIRAWAPEIPLWGDSIFITTTASSSDLETSCAHPWSALLLGRDTLSRVCYAKSLLRAAEALMSTWVHKPATFSTIIPHRLKPSAVRLPSLCTNRHVPLPREPFKQPSLS